MNPARHRWLWLTALVLLAVLAGGILLLFTHWPFRREKVTKAFQDVMGGEVRIAKFTNTYFPPGCVAEGLAVRGNLITARKLTIASSYLRLFQGLDRVQADGLVVRLPANRDGLLKRSSSKRSQRVATEFIANGAVLVVEPKEAGAEPLRFVAREFTMGPVGANRPLHYRAVFDLPKPPGAVRTSGELGPWNWDNVDGTPVSGNYSLSHADLGVFKGLEGIFESEGQFHGRLGHIDVDGTGDMPDFALRRAEHPVKLTSRFHAVVNGTDGDVTFEPAEVRLQRTNILAHGEVTGKEGVPGKTVAVDMRVTEGHVQDLLRFFLNSPRPPMTGLISLRAHAVVPPRDEKFLKKLRLQGDFGVGDAKFSSPKTRKSVDVLSERARGEKDYDNPEDVISNLKGHVSVQDGIAQLSNVSFSVPGAVARLRGTYGLLTEAVDLRGTLTMEATVSEANKGVKSFLLKAVNPFFKKKGSNAGAVVPIKITGTYSHPSFGLALGEKR